MKLDFYLKGRGFFPKRMWFYLFFHVTEKHRRSHWKKQSELSIHNTDHTVFWGASY